MATHSLSLLAVLSVAWVSIGGDIRLPVDAMAIASRQQNVYGENAVQPNCT
jgi:hypothetical protein